MNIFICTPLTGIKDPEKTKAFYQKIGDMIVTLGHTPFLAFLNGTDPIKNPNVTPQEVYKRDHDKLIASNIVLAYVDEPSLGVGQEIEIAKENNIPVYLLYQEGKRISRMTLGSPIIKGEIQFADEEDAIKQLEQLLRSFETI